MPRSHLRAVHVLHEARVDGQIGEKSHGWRIGALSAEKRRGRWGVLEQNFYTKTVIHGLATPKGDGGVLIYLDALPLVVFEQLVPVQRTGVVGHYTLEALAVGFDETQCAVVQNLHYYPTLVNLTVVKSAELHEVRELGFAPVRPMLNVVCVYVVRI